VKKKFEVFVSCSNREEGFLLGASASLAKVSQDREKRTKHGSNNAPLASKGSLESFLEANQQEQTKERKLRRAILLGLRTEYSLCLPSTLFGTNASIHEIEIVSFYLFLRSVVSFLHT
jgi:hypothetical protein